jgi:hypothetical protein
MANLEAPLCLMGKSKIGMHEFQWVSELPPSSPILAMPFVCSTMLPHEGMCLAIKHDCGIFVRLAVHPGTF